MTGKVKLQLLLHTLYDESGEFHKNMLLTCKLNLGEEKEGWKSGGWGECARTVVRVDEDSGF